MDRVKRTVSGLVSNKKFLIVFILTLVFLAAALYTYKTYIKSKVNATYVANNEFVQGPAPTTEVVDLYFFYTTWCPHCKKAKPIWEQLKNEIGDNAYKGTKINSPIEYAAIKAGIINITFYLAKYFKKKNIRVNCVSPGGIFSNQNKIFINNYRKMCNSKGLLDSKDVSDLVIFLLSNKSPTEYSCPG